MQQLHDINHVYAVAIKGHHLHNQSQGLTIVVYIIYKYLLVLFV